MISFYKAFQPYSYKNCDSEMSPNWKKSHGHVKSNSIYPFYFIMGTHSFFFPEQLKYRLHTVLLDNFIIYFLSIFLCSHSLVTQHGNFVSFFWFSKCIVHIPGSPVSSSTESGPGWWVAFCYHVSYLVSFYINLRQSLSSLLPSITMMVLKTES